MSSSIKLTNSSGKIVTITNPDTTSADVAVDLLNNAYTIATVDDFGTVPVGYTTVIVKDTDRGGVFNRIASTTANGGTIFDGTTGYSWERQYSGAVNVKWFGAKGDGVTDDTVAIQNALLLNKTIIFENGIFLSDNVFSNTLDIIEIYGENAKIKPYTQHSNFLHYNGALPLEMVSITIAGINFEGFRNTVLLKVNCTRAVFERNVVKNSVIGVYLYGNVLDARVVDNTFIDIVNDYTTSITMGVVVGTDDYTTYCKTTVTNNTFENINYSYSSGELRDVKAILVFGDSAIISNNNINGVYSYYGDDCEAIYTKARNSIIESNIINNGSQGGDGAIVVKQDQSLLFSESQTTKIHSNYIYFSGSLTYYTSGINCFVGNCSIENNTIENTNFHAIKTVYSGNYVSCNYIKNFKNTAIACGDGIYSGNSFFNIKKDSTSNICYNISESSLNDKKLVSISDSIWDLSEAIVSNLNTLIFVNRQIDDSYSISSTKMVSVKNCKVITNNNVASATAYGAHYSLKSGVLSPNTFFEWYDNEIPRDFDSALKSFPQEYVSTDINFYTTAPINSSYPFVIGQIIKANPISAGSVASWIRTNAGPWVPYVTLP